MKLILDEWIVREVIDTLNMARTTLLGITGLDTPQEVAKKSSENETAITRRISKAIDIIQQVEQPSLPEGLDEAAEKSAKSWRKNPDGSESREMLFQPHIRGFKAGAEWMAGQGSTIKARVDKTGIFQAVITAGLREALVHFKNEAEVIIQIRKK